MDPIEEIRAAVGEDRALPGVAYRSDAIFAAEAETVFRNSWISVACGQNVPERGDLFPVRIAGQSLLVLRNGDGVIRVFYNLCRHRGAPLATAPCRARGGRIVCPYHAWSYGLDGQLAAAPHFHRDDGAGQPSESERKALELLAVRTAVWRDIVFVNLSRNAVAFEDFIRPLDERIARFDAAELVPHSSDEYEIQANWKLTAENFLDVYHLPTVHPEISDGFSSILAAADVELSEDIVGVILPDFYAEDSGQAEPELPRFSGLDAHESQVEVFSVFPNTLILVEPDNQQVIVLRPQTAEVTHETFANYLVSDASQAEDLAKARAELLRSAIEINDQDAVLLAGLQQTRSMDVGGQTQLTDSWDKTNQRFQRLWARKLLGEIDR